MTVPHFATRSTHQRDRNRTGIKPASNRSESLEGEKIVIAGNVSIAKPGEEDSPLPLSDVEDHSYVFQQQHQVKFVQW